MSQHIDVDFNHCGAVSRPFMTVQNKASVAYYLMFDNQMRMKSGAYLREELSEASDAMMQHPSGAAAVRR